MLELPHDVCSAFDIKYKPPGYVSAGLKCEMEIVFRPKVGLQGSTLFLLVAASGMYQNLPCICTVLCRLTAGSKEALLSTNWSVMYHNVAGGRRHRHLNSTTG